MTPYYVMISCSADTLAVALNVLKGHHFVQISLTDPPNVTYFGFEHRNDSLVIVGFAKNNGFAYEELDASKMREKSFRPGSVKISGDTAMADWLAK